jgi:hypothetical protein
LNRERRRAAAAAPPTRCTLSGHRAFHQISASLPFGSGPSAIERTALRNRYDIAGKIAPRRLLPGLVSCRARQVQSQRRNVAESLAMRRGDGRHQGQVPQPAPTGTALTGEAGVVSGRVAAPAEAKFRRCRSDFLDGRRGLRPGSPANEPAAVKARLPDAGSISSS